MGTYVTGVNVVVFQVKHRSHGLSPYQTHTCTHTHTPPHSSSFPRRRRSADRCCGGCRWRSHWPSHTGPCPDVLRSSSRSSEEVHTRTHTEQMTLPKPSRSLHPGDPDCSVRRDRVSTWRQSALRCSSLCGRASLGDSAPSGSSRIWGPWHSTWRHVSLWTFLLLGFPSLLNRNDLRRKRHRQTDRSGENKRRYY